MMKNQLLNIKSLLKPSVVAVLLMLLISGYALFFEPLIGLADNGDFGRVMYPSGLKHETERDINDFFGYFNNRYERLQYHNEVEGTIKSTHISVVQAAMFLDDLITGDNKFDIRYYAFICLVVLALALYWLVEVVDIITTNKLLKYIFALIAVIIYADTGYTSYFNSFFGEGLAYTFFLLSVGAIFRSYLADKGKLWYLIVFFTSTIIFMGSKNQYLTNGILATLLILPLLFINIKKNIKIVAGIMSVILLLTAVYMYSIIDDTIYLINKYHMMTRGVMLFEGHAVQDATEKAGLGEQYALLAETIYFDRTPVIDPQDELLLDDFYSRYDLVTVTVYYVTNPTAFSKMMELGWKNVYTIRPEVIGNYTRASEREFAEMTSYFTSWSYFKDNYLPHHAGLAYLFIVICLSLTLNRILGYRKNKKPTMFYFVELIMIYLMLTALSQIVVSFVGGGDTDFKKHLFMSVVSLDLLFFFNFTYLVSFITRSRRKVIEIKVKQFLELFQSSVPDEYKH